MREIQLGDAAGWSNTILGFNLIAFASMVAAEAMLSAHRCRREVQGFKAGADPQDVHVSSVLSQTACLPVTEG